MDWAGTAEKGLRVVPGVDGGTSGWSKCGVPLCGDGSGSIRVGASARRVGLLFQGDVSAYSVGVGVGSGPLWSVGVLRPCSGATVCLAAVLRQPRCYVCGATTSLCGMW